ncbi:MAG: aldehyde dehydrogenase family protein [Anaerolineae bacterium]|nr:aldehyde dehydrogenase family protein [Anaerolineae bacterium]
MEIKPLQNYVAAQFVDPGECTDAWVHNPSTGEPIQPQWNTTSAEIEQALQLAWEVHQARIWSGVSAEDRATLLEAIADRLQQNVEHIARVDSFNTGVIIALTRTITQITHLAFRAAATQVREGLVRALPGPHGTVEILRKPWGPALCIVPWNAPAALAAHKIANALAAGCPTILKPSEWAPYSSQLLAEAVDQVGLPPGVFQVLNGGPRVGAALVSDSRIKAVSFTGGLHGGRAVARACATDFKPAQLELGGNNALIVLDDADLDRAADGVVAGLTTLNGQWCRALGRLLLHETIADKLLDRVVERLRRLRIGNALDEESEMGPLIHSDHRDAINTTLSGYTKKGGKIIQVSALPESPGCYFAPALVVGVASAETRTEIFGPVAAVHTFATDDEAVALANETPYGLGGYVFGRDENRALHVARQMRTGGVKINGVSLMSLNHMAPRPAWGLSGLGVEGTRETFDFFCGVSVVGIAAR